MEDTQGPIMDEAFCALSHLDSIIVLTACFQVLLIFVLDIINSVCDCVYLYDSLILHFGGLSRL
jgi:hypothetical protein